VIASLLFLGFSNFALLSASAADVCSEEYKSDALLPDNVVAIDWGVRVNSLYADTEWEENEIQQRPEIEYEQDVRVTYDQEAVSITSFWKGCESFIGRQGKCESDQSLSMVLAPNQLNDSLLVQGSLVRNNSKNITSFSEPYDDSWQVSENPVLEEIFSVSMTENEVDALGDFTQLGIRQAIRITVDVNQSLYQFELNELQLPFHILTSQKGLFTESKVILKAFHTSGDYVEQAYMANRSLLEENFQTSYCRDNTCGFEYLISDLYNVKEIFNIYSKWSKEDMICTVSSGLLIHWLSANLPYPEIEIRKAIFHYEIQTSIINSNNIDDFNPLDYMDRDLTLPKENSGGGLYYFLILLLILSIRFRRQEFMNC